MKKRIFQGLALLLALSLGSTLVIAAQLRTPKPAEPTEPTPAGIAPADPDVFLPSTKAALPVLPEPDEVFLPSTKAAPPPLPEPPEIFLPSTKAAPIHLRQIAPEAQQQAPQQTPQQRARP